MQLRKLEFMNHILGLVHDKFEFINQFMPIPNKPVAPFQATTH